MVIEVNAMYIIQLTITLFLLNIADFMTTKAMVDQFGFEMESNPILLWLMYQTDTVYAILWLKLLFFCLLVPALIFNKKTSTLTPDSIGRILAVLCVCFTIIVGLNTFHLFSGV